MPDCENINGCSFFNDKMDNMAGIASLLKTKYCKGDKTDCARYVIAKSLGPKFMPEGLFPNQLSKAKDIIEKNKEFLKK